MAAGTFIINKMVENTIEIQLIWEEPAKFENFLFLRDECTYWHDDGNDLLVIEDSISLNPLYPKALLQNSTVNRYFISGHIGSGENYIGGLSKLPVFSGLMNRLFEFCKPGHIWAYRKGGEKIRYPQRPYQQWGNNLYQGSGETCCDYLVYFENLSSFRIALEPHWEPDLFLIPKSTSDLLTQIENYPLAVINRLSNIADRTSRSLKVLREIVSSCELIILRETAHNGNDFLFYTEKQILESLREIVTFLNVPVKVIP